MTRGAKVGQVSDLPKSRTCRQAIMGRSKTCPAWAPDKRFAFESTARDSGRIRLGRAVVAEVRRLELINYRPVRGAAPLVGEDAGVPLYWRQYGNHQGPERSANSHRRLTLLASGPGWLQLRATGRTRSKSIASVFIVTVQVDAQGRVALDMQARLEVLPGPGWLVTPHPDHGEVTFCTLWPAGVFAPDGRAPKRYQSCLAFRGTKVSRIEHHHLGSPDKHHIRLGDGDHFAWVLEDFNPVITLWAGPRVEAGVCAYMWDTHFGLKICRAGRPVTLRPGTVLTAGYSLTAASRAAMHRWVKQARLLSPGPAADTPVWTGGRHTFQETFRSAGIDRNTAWPWETAVISGRAQYAKWAHDLRTGCSDHFSLRIHHRAAVQSCWRASTLGSAFGEPAFRRGGRLRVRAMVRTRDLRGEVSVVLRLHRTGRGSVFDAATYETHVSPVVRTVNQDWLELTVTTPAITPAPDRVHLLLQLNGKGTAWFDDVEFTRISRGYERERAGRGGHPAMRSVGRAGQRSAMGRSKTCPALVAAKGVRT
jgi:hypothetical protein